MSEIARKEEQLLKLDARIKEMNARLGTTAADTEDGFDTEEGLDVMLAMVREKEYQAKRLEELRRKREEEVQKRLAEIKSLKIEQAMKRQGTMKEDIRKYEEIVSSEYGSSMKVAAWNNLVSRYPEAAGITTGDIQSLKYLAGYLRSSFRKLTISQVQTMPGMSMREKLKNGFYGHSTVNHSYEKTSISGDTVVIDHTTDLMWHQSGSDKPLKWKKAKRWMEKLNKAGYAGYHGWRLPTLEEAATLLLESARKNGLYIDRVFDAKAESIWTGDVYDSEDSWYLRLYEWVSGSIRAWYVRLHYGCVMLSDAEDHIYVRPVRSGTR